MLETVVGRGAGVDWTGAGAELGGASVGDGDEPPEPDPPDELDEPDELDLGLGPDELAEPGALEDVAGWSGCALGRTPAAVRRAVLWCR